MARTKLFLRFGALVLAVAGCRGGARAPSPQVRAVPSASPSAAPAAPRLTTPTVLVTLPVSAYNAWLALDGEVTYLLTPSAGYRLLPGKPAQRIDIALGNGPVLTDTGIVYWSKGAIWSAAKDSTTVWRLASVAKQPDYFVTADGRVAWLDRGEDGLYRIWSLDGQKPRVLLSRPGEISALHMVHAWIFFVERAADTTWRIGRVPVTGGQPEYTASRSGPTPALLRGSESVVYYDMQRSEVRQLTTDLKSENVWLRDFVCSPMDEAASIYCARVEGLFAVPPDTRTPRPLVSGDHLSITHVRAGPGRVAWIADAGPDRLMVETLPVE